MSQEKNALGSGLHNAGESLQKVVEQHGPWMMTLAWHILGNREDAEDVCQEAFLQAFRYLGRFDPEKSLRSWLATIVVRRSFDLMRKRKRFRRFLEVFNRQWWPAKQPGIKAPSLNNFEPMPCLALDGLSSRERAVLTLWALEGYTSEEIAAVLGCRASTARVHLFLARKKIKAFLEKQNVKV